MNDRSGYRRFKLVVKLHEPVTLPDGSMVAILTYPALTLEIGHKMLRDHFGEEASLYGACQAEGDGWVELDHRTALLWLGPYAPERH